MNPSSIHYFSNNIEVNIVSGKKICEEKGKLLNPFPTRQVYFLSPDNLPSGNRVLIKEKKYNCEVILEYLCTLICQQQK